jgi:hypothetical protein
MFFDVLRRYPEVESHYSNAGWISNHFMLFRPMSEHLFSVYLAFSSPNEVHFLMQLHMLACVLFMVGWRTRLMHVVCAILLVSLNSRNIMVREQGSWCLVSRSGPRFCRQRALQCRCCSRVAAPASREGGAEGLNHASDRAPDGADHACRDGASCGCHRFFQRRPQERARSGKTARLFFTCFTKIGDHGLGRLGTRIDSPGIRRSPTRAQHRGAGSGASSPGSTGAAHDRAGGRASPLHRGGGRDPPVLVGDDHRVHRLRARSVWDAVASGSTGATPVLPSFDATSGF